MKTKMRVLGKSCVKVLGVAEKSARLGGRILDHVTLEPVTQAL